MSLRPPPTYPLSINTLGACLDHGYSITAYCDNQACRHKAKLNLESLAARLGRDHSMMARDLLPRLKCTKCGGKNLSMIIGSPTD